MSTGSDRLLRWLRLPPPPAPPPGDPRSLRVLKASERFLRYRQLQWLLTHLGVLLPALLLPMGVVMAVALGHLGKRPPPDWVAALMLALSGLVIAGWWIAAAISFALLRLDRDQRTYLLTDASLRVREGLWTVREITLGFVNVQQISVSQGPIERLFGIASIEVRTAGGGGAQQHAAAGVAGAVSGHQAVLRGLDDAKGLRDALVLAVRNARAGALPEDAGSSLGVGMAAASPGAGELAALREVAAEARCLRLAVCGRDAAAPPLPRPLASGVRAATKPSSAATD